MFFSGFGFTNSVLKPKQANTIINVSQSPQKLKERKDFSRLIQSYNQILAKTQGEFGVTFLDLTTGEKVGINNEKTFHVASTTKPILAAFALAQVDQGKLTLDDKVSGLPLSERIRLMINISDNDSWEALLNYFGIPAIQNFSRSLGLTSTNHFKNISTSDDLAKFLVRIYQGPILSEQNRQFLLKFMQNTEREDRISAGIPNKQLVFHKGGTFEGEIHDIGIIVHPANPFVLAILSDGQNDLDTRPAILAEIAKVSWEFANLE